MTSSLELEGEVLVVGGTGSIGSAIVKRLLENKYRVAVMSRRLCRGGLPISKICGSEVRELYCDVTDGTAVDRCFTEHYGTSGRLAGVVYAVGHCPPGGFDEETRAPLSDISVSRFNEELARHVTGLFIVTKRASDLIQSGGHIVVIGSAVTRLTDETCPPWLHCGHYAAAKAAQAELINWLRREPKLRDRNILVHRLAPAAVDTPFHEECKRRPKAMLSVDDVARRVLDAMRWSTPVDVMMIA